MKTRTSINDPRAMARAEFEAWLATLDEWRAIRLRGSFLDAIARIDGQLAGGPPPAAGPGWRERAEKARGICQARAWTVKKHLRALKRKGAA